MADRLRFEDIRDAFVDDDILLRDLYAFETTAVEWDRFLVAIAHGPWKVELWQGEDSLDIEMLNNGALKLIEIENRVLLKVFVQGAQFHCHFFCADQIEMDIEAKEISNDNFAALCEFMAFMAHAIDRNVFLTIEGNPQDGILAYCSASDSFLPLNRPRNSTDYSTVLAEGVATVIAPFLEEDRSSRCEVPMHEEAITAARMWRAKWYHPDRLDWHTKLTSDEFRALEDLDRVLSTFYEEPGPKALCEKGGFEIAALLTHFWDALDTANSVIGDGHH